MTYRINGWSHDQRRFLDMTYTRQQVWAWLKAENHHRPPKDERRVIPNRAARRRMSKTWKRIEMGKA